MVNKNNHICILLTTYEVKENRLYEGSEKGGRCINASYKLWEGGPVESSLQYDDGRARKCIVSHHCKTVVRGPQLQYAHGEEFNWAIFEIYAWGRDLLNAKREEIIKFYVGH